MMKHYVFNLQEAREDQVGQGVPEKRENKQ